MRKNEWQDVSIHPPRRKGMYCVRGIWATSGKHAEGIAYWKSDEKLFDVYWNFEVKEWKYIEVKKKDEV